MVEQLGLAIILCDFLISFALISGTISGIVLSILKKEELSITVVPLSANLRAHFSEIELPAENIAMSGFLIIDSSIEIIVSF